METLNRRQLPGSLRVSGEGYRLRTLLILLAVGPVVLASLVAALTPTTVEETLTITDQEGNTEFYWRDATGDWQPGPHPTTLNRP
jgi:hypothetical protein